MVVLKQEEENIAYKRQPLYICICVKVSSIGFFGKLISQVSLDPSLASSSYWSKGWLYQIMNNNPEVGTLGHILVSAPCT